MYVYYWYKSLSRVLLFKTKIKVTATKSSLTVKDLLKHRWNSKKSQFQLFYIMDIKIAHCSQTINKSINKQNTEIH